MLAEAGTGGHTLSLAPPRRFKHYHGWQPAEALPGTEKARKEITGRKLTQALLQAQSQFSVSHTFPRLAQQRPSPLLSYKLLVVYDHVAKQGRCCEDSTNSPPSQSPGHHWVAKRGFRVSDTITSHSSSHHDTDACRYDPICNSLSVSRGLCCDYFNQQKSYLLFYPVHTHGPIVTTSHS